MRQSGVGEAYRGPVATVWLFPAPEAELARLQKDPSRARLLGAVNRVLDQLEDDPKHRSVRMRRFQSRPLWGVTIISGREEYVLLWEPHPTGPDDVAVRYLGPAPIA